MTARMFFYRLGRNLLLVAGLVLIAALPVAAQTGQAGQSEQGSAARPTISPPAPAMIQNDSAVLQGLDKVTARVSRIEAPVGSEVSFGTLRITVRACYSRPPEEAPESTAFLEIKDEKPGEQPAHLYSGWMFASSPAINALEHPVYVVWVISCKKLESSSSLSSGGNVAEQSSAYPSKSR